MRAQLAQQKKLAAGFHAVADHLAATVCARGRQPVDRALEAVEHVAQSRRR